MSWLFCSQSPPWVSKTLAFLWDLPGFASSLLVGQSIFTLYAAQTKFLQGLSCLLEFLQPSSIEMNSCLSLWCLGPFPALD